MPIKKPGQSKDSVHTNAIQGIDTVNDKAADEFINRVTDKPAQKPKRKNKVQMMMRIDPDILERIDEKAKAKGLSRSALISLACSDYLDTH